MFVKYGYGVVGNFILEGSYGFYGIRVGNMMDLRVDFDWDGGCYCGMGGVGNSYLLGLVLNIVGLYKLDLLNKLDLRVDSKGGMMY